MATQTTQASVSPHSTIWIGCHSSDQHLTTISVSRTCQHLNFIGMQIVRIVCRWHRGFHDTSQESQRSCSGRDPYRQFLKRQQQVKLLWDWKWCCSRDPQMLEMSIYNIRWEETGAVSKGSHGWTSWMSLKPKDRIVYATMWPEWQIWTQRTWLKDQCLMSWGCSFLGVDYVNRCPLL
jgi:hypothetical protein